jgi:hypothetical protein
MEGVSMKTLATTIWTALAVLSASGAFSEDCTIGVYADPQGSERTLFTGLPWGDDEISIYVVMFTEDSAAAASYRLVTNEFLLIKEQIAGPFEFGLWFDEPTGTNVAFTECAFGFNSTPIVVMEYVIDLRFPEFEPRLPISLEANTSQGDTPMYVTCNDIMKPCDIGHTLLPVPNYARSFGSIKSLYR